LVLILSQAFMQLVYSVEVYMVYYLVLHNEGSIVVCMKARNILSKRFLNNWVAVNFGCTGKVLILSVYNQFGAPLHTAHPDTEGVDASMLQLHTHEPPQWSSHPSPSPH